MNRTNTNQNRTMQGSSLANISPKTMAAAVLMCTMVVLWGRVLLSGKNAPEKALAEEAAAVEQMPAASSGRTLKFKPVALGCLAGRNDRLTTDLFNSDRWTAFDFNDGGKGKNDVDVADDGHLEEKRHLADLEALSKELLLEAVIQGSDGNGMQAFIGGKVLMTGQVLPIKRQSQVYDLVVTNIAAQEVTLAWRTYSICLKITESHEQ